jgi:hypothetical protein
LYSHCFVCFFRQSRTRNNQNQRQLQTETAATATPPKVPELSLASQPAPTTRLWDLTRFTATRAAAGSNSLSRNTTGFSNTATGSFALYLNTEGNGNTATGVDTLSQNTFGGGNTATGAAAMESNTIGGFNTATGNGALSSNTTGGTNTACGAGALYSNTNGDGNTSNGDGALLNNRAGSYNTASGYQALWRNTSGNSNIALGVSAGSNLSTGSSNIDIGNIGVDGEAYTIRIGDVQTRTFIGGIRGANTGNADAIPVVIDSAGQLGTASSSRRFKDEIKPMDKTSEAILKLKPVTFQYKGDTKGNAQFGLIAEEVAAVNPELVVRDAEGEIYTVRYEAVSAMLLNEFLKEHRTVQELKSIVTEQQKQIDTLTASVQKVNALTEVTKSPPQVADNNR